MLRTEIVGLDGKLSPMRLRYYQVQGIYHLLKLRRMILGDGTGLGKTLQILGFFAYVWEMEHDSKYSLESRSKPIGTREIIEQYLSNDCLIVLARVQQHDLDTFKRGLIHILKDTPFDLSNYFLILTVVVLKVDPRPVSERVRCHVILRLAVKVSAFPRRPEYSFRNGL
jgi:hypothetical protein